MLSTIAHKHLAAAAMAGIHSQPLVQIARKTVPPIIASRALSSNIAWSHDKPSHHPYHEPHVTIQHNLTDTLESTADMYENETTTTLEKMEKAAQRKKGQDPMPSHNYSQTASGLVDEAYKRELDDPSEAKAACKVNLRSDWPDFLCTTTTCTKNYHSGIAVPDIAKDCSHGPCLDLDHDPCLEAVYKSWMVVEPVGLGCKYGRSCPLPNSSSSTYKMKEDGL